MNTALTLSPTFREFFAAHFAMRTGAASKKFDSKAFDADHPGLREKYMADYVKDGGLRFSPAKG